MHETLSRQIRFLTEIDRLKIVLRQSRIADGSRRENSAEHSWHLAMFAIVLAGDRIDACKVIAMLLIHDIVEIDCGDTPFHSGSDQEQVAEKEKAAAERIFGLLPDAQSSVFIDLWNEFEAGESAEARFARSLDRFQPLLLNTLTGGGTWVDNGVSEQQVYERYGPVISRGSPELWECALKLVERHFAKVTDDSSTL